MHCTGHTGLCKDIPKQINNITLWWYDINVNTTYCLVFTTDLPTRHREAKRLHTNDGEKQWNMWPVKAYKTVMKTQISTFSVAGHVSPSVSHKHHHPRDKNVEEALLDT